MSLTDTKTLENANRWYWKGKSLEDMNVEELREALIQTLNQMRDHYSTSNIRANALGRVEMLKRGER